MIEKIAKMIKNIILYHGTFEIIVKSGVCNYMIYSFSCIFVTLFGVFIVGLMLS